MVIPTIMKSFSLHYFRVLLLILLLSSVFTKAQSQVIPPTKQNKANFFDKVRFGGGVGLGFGDGFFSGTLAPSAIYQFNQQFALGVGLNGTYNKSKKPGYNSTIFGGSVMALYQIIPEIQLSGEFEELHVVRRWEHDGGNLKDDYWVPALFFGVGFSSKNVTMGLRYNVLHDRKSIYGNAYMPFVRVYF